jgi:hypothetical protein
MDTHVALRDMNGDGLPDRVMREDPSAVSRLLVQYNTGTEFSQWVRAFVFNSQSTLPRWGSIAYTDRSARFLFLANGSPAVQGKALSQVVSPTFTMLDTMNLWIEIAREELLAIIRKVDALILNDEEARMLTGERNLLRAATAALDLGPRTIVLKKGEHGAFLISRGARLALPAYPVENVVDPTGAGDSFAGGFMGYLAAAGDAEPKTLRRAMLHGTAAASFCVEGFGVERLASASRREIDARCDELLSLVSV